MRFKRKQCTNCGLVQLRTEKRCYNCNGSLKNVELTLRELRGK